MNDLPMIKFCSEFRKTKCNFIQIRSILSKHKYYINYVDIVDQ